MKILPLLFLCALLGACTVSPLEYKAAERICSDHGGVYRITPMISDLFVDCQDGSQLVQNKADALYREKTK